MTKHPQRLIAASLALAALAGCGGSDAPPQQMAAAGTPVFLTSAVVSKTYAGTRDRWTLQRTSNGLLATDRTGGTGSSTTANLTAAAFSDATVNLNVGDLSKTIDAADLKLIVELYIAFFNRIPDADGMTFWIGQRKAGVSTLQIAETFYGVAIGPDFSALTGYSANMAVTDFIKIIYKNVLGRSTVDQGGLDYWTGQLASGAATRGSLVKDIISAAHGYKGDPTFGPVADLLDNKADVGTYFAIQQGLTFAGTSADVYNKSAQISAAVNSTSTAAAKALFALSDTGFDLRTAPTVVQSAVPTFAQIVSIVQNRCLDCHSNSIANAGVSFSSAGQIRAQAANIYANAGISDFMPQNNSTGMTPAERKLIVTWFEAGAPQ